MANWFLLLHPPDRRNPGKRTDSQAGNVVSPRKRKLRKLETKGSDPDRIVSRVAQPSWFCLDEDFGFRSRCARRGGRE
jgi:ribosomal protein L34